MVLTILVEYLFKSYHIQTRCSVCHRSHRYCCPQPCDYERLPVKVTRLSIKRPINKVSEKVCECLAEWMNDGKWLNVALQRMWTIWNRSICMHRTRLYVHRHAFTDYLETICEHRMRKLYGSFYAICPSSYLLFMLI